MAEVAVVTGANSGIGRATAIQLARGGYSVYATVRRASTSEKLNAMASEAGVEVRVVEIDVANEESVRNGFGLVLAETGRVDVLVNNAGIAPRAVVEECSSSLYLDVMNVNLCGAVRCIQAVLPGMRERQHGAIVNVSSVAGRVALIGQSPYVASKFALEGMSEGLSQELAPFGIRVVIVEPGVTKTAIYAKESVPPRNTGAYDAPYRRLVAFYSAGLPHATDPFEVGEAIRQAITTADPRLRWRVGWGASELIAQRARMSDEEWVELGGHTRDVDYCAEFTRLFGIAIAPPT